MIMVDFRFIFNFPQGVKAIIKVSGYMWLNFHRRRQIVEFRVQTFVITMLWY